MADIQYEIIVRDTEVQLSEAVRVALLCGMRPIGHILLDGDKLLQVMRIEEASRG